MNKWNAILFTVVSIGVTALYTTLAWGGDHYALLALAVLSVIEAIFAGLFLWEWKVALKGWGRSTSGWASSQTWAIQQNIILRDTLNELRAYDEEAFSIHSGRATSASFEYLKSSERG